MNAPDPWEAWVKWCADHPRTILYLVAVTTANLLISLIELVK